MEIENEKSFENFKHFKHLGNHIYYTYNGKELYDMIAYNESMIYFK